MESGSQALSRKATAYVVSLAFTLAFLLATAAGCDGNTALLRAAGVAAAALVAGSLLAAPVVDAVLAAMARDASSRRGRTEDGEEER